MLSSGHLFGQKIVNGRGVELSPSTCVLYNSNDQFEATGTYTFGDSEWESTLIIMESNIGHIAQFQYTDVIDRPNPFVPRFTNLENVKIVDGIFSANGWKGQFAFCSDTSHDSVSADIISSNGLVIYVMPPSPELLFENEFGIQHSGFSNVRGKYPEASYRLRKN